MLRIHLAAYADARDAKTYRVLANAWEALAAIDPYFHVAPEALVAGSVQRVIVDGPWIVGPDRTALATSCVTNAPMLRADWFCGQLLQPEAYYAFSGVSKSEEKFFRNLAVDLALAEHLAANTGANLARSKITQRNRRIVETPGIHGPAFVTLDVAQQTPDRDVFRNPVAVKGLVDFKHDASEVFAMKSNGLWLMALFNAAGERQDAVPQAVVAGDPHSVGAQQPVQPPISCLKCHTLHGGVGALQPFADQQSILPIGPGTAPEVAQRIREFYDPERQKVRFQRAEEDYARAVDTATGGMTPVEIVTVLARIYSEVVELPVTLSSAAAEFELTEDQARSFWGASEDPALNLLLRGQEITREAWETAYSEAATRVDKTLVP